jgi:arabinogalactan endo-1,4-beta-galactosidase
MSCVKEQNPKGPIALFEIGVEGNITDEAVAYDIFDLRDFGFWNLTINKDFLTQLLEPSEQYTLMVKDVAYAFSENKFKPLLLQANLPEGLTREEIKAGVIKKTEQQQPTS